MTAINSRTMKTPHATSTEKLNTPPPSHINATKMSFMAEMRKMTNGLAESSKLKRSISFFKDKVKGLSARTRADKTKFPIPGQIYMYGYDAKYKDTLPYWDALPLIILVNYTNNGFIGLNLHYLIKPLRVELLTKLKMVNQKTKDASPVARSKINYQYLQSMIGGRVKKLIEPTVHRYLLKQTRSQFAIIDPNDWSNIVNLPEAKWKGKHAGGPR